MKRNECCYIVTVVTALLFLYKSIYIYIFYWFKKKNVRAVFVYFSKGTKTIVHGINQLSHAKNNIKIYSKHTSIIV